MPQAIAHRLFKNISWLSVQELVSRTAGLLIAIYLARVLEPADYGSLTVALSLVATLALLVRAGTGSRATRLTALDSIRR